MTQKPRILIDVVADPVCPWCYVGLRSFLMAKTELSSSVDILPRFRPYQLNPDTPLEGADREAYYAKKFPDAEFRAQMRDRLTESARLAGFEFDPGIPTRLPNTLKAHQLMRWAHFCGAQETLGLTLYSAFWERDADLGDTETLVGIAAEAGMDAEETRAKFAANTDRKVVQQEAEAFRAAGVTGVPTFIVNEEKGFSGALPPKDLAAAIRHAAGD